MDENKLALLLKTLYSSTDNESIQSASKQLNDWQQTVDAWKQADQLLGTPGLQGEFYYFFAQTLKTKIQYDMYQLGPNQCIPLRDSVMQKILSIHHTSAAKATRKQLCLALADLTIQTIDVWPNAIPDLVNLLAQNHPLELLDILRLLPEETENLKLMTESGKRNQSRFKCIEYYPSVLALLNQQFLTATNRETQDLVLECFLAWLRFDAPPVQYSLADSPLVNHCLSQIALVTRDNLSVEDKCVEILSEVLRSTNDYRNRASEQFVGHPLIETRIFPQVHALAQVLLPLNLQKAIDDGSTDIDSVKSLARLVTLTADGIMGRIVASAGGATDPRIAELLSVILKFLSVHSIEVSEIAAMFFEDFIAATAPPVGTAKHSTPLIDQLFETLVVRCDVATETSFNQADPFTSVDTDYYYFRNSDLLKLLYTISRDFLGRSVGVEKLIRGLVLHADATPPHSLSLQEAFAVCVKDQLTGVTDPSESSRTAVEFLMERLPLWIQVETVHACSVMDAFRRRALIALVGSLAAWIRTPDQLFRLINLCAQILIRPAVVHRSLHSAAAVAVRELCMHSHCREMIINGSGPEGAVASITNLFSQTIGHLPASEHSILTEGIVSVLSAHGDDALFVSLVRGSILAPLIDSLNQYRSSADVGNTGIVIDRMTAVVRSMNRLPRGQMRYNAIGELVVNALWPSLAASMEKFRTEPDLVEKSCRLLKHTLRAVPDFFKQLLIPLGQLLIRDFAQCQHSSYLYTAEVLGQEFAGQEDVRPALGELFDSLVSAGVRLLETKLHAGPMFAGSPDNTDELTEDLFGLIERYLRYSPGIVVRSPALTAVLRLLVPAFASMRRKETIEAVSAFVEQIYSGEWTRNASGSIDAVSDETVNSVRRSLEELAPVLICQLFDLMIQVCGRSMRMAIPSILMVMYTFEPAGYRTDWIRRALSRVPASILTDKEKVAAADTLCSEDDERAVSRCVEDILYRAELVARRVRNEQSGGKQ